MKKVTLSVLSALVFVGGVASALFVLVVFTGTVYGSDEQPKSEQLPTIADYQWKPVVGGEDIGLEMFLNKNDSVPTDALVQANRERNVNRAENVTALAALFWNNIHGAARTEGGYKKLLSLKGIKAVLVRTLRNFFGLKQSDDDTFMRRLGRAGVNWISLMVLLINVDRNNDAMRDEIINGIAFDMYAFLRSKSPKAYERFKKENPDPMCMPGMQRFKRNDLRFGGLW